MKVLNSWLERQVVFSLVMFLIAPIGVFAATPQQVAHETGSAVSNESSSQIGSQKVSTSLTEESPLATYPNSPGTLLAQAADQNQQPPQTQQTPTPPSAKTNQQNPAPAPLGTAAAPYEKPEGVSGSKPTGAAIAPGRQRRTRSFAIRIGLLVGAAVAIGVVTAASLSSPSRAH